MSETEAEALLHDWAFWARPNQLPPLGEWFVWMLRWGRGSGKTRSANEWLLKREASGYKRFAVIGQTKGDVRDTLIEVGESAIMNIAPPWNIPSYEPSKRRTTWKSGAMAVLFSGDEPDQLRGGQFDSAVVDELAKFKYPQDTWDNLEMCMRLSEDPRIVVATTPRPIPIIKTLVQDPQCVDTKGSTYENIHNLAPAYVRRLLTKYEGTRLGRQELYAEILDDNPDALWKRETLERTRMRDHPVLLRIAVGVDPEATDSETSSETGIVVAGIARVDGKIHGYILEDLTIKGSPDQWASEAIAGYNKHHADVIVAEINNGGDMVIHTITTVDDRVNCKSVRASRGKYTRAEPISALYEQGRVHHVGTFADLEDQLCEWVPGDKSPDRLDALVWVLTELILENTAGEVSEEDVAEDSLLAFAGLSRRTF